MNHFKFDQIQYKHNLVIFVAGLIKLKVMNGILREINLFIITG